MKKLIAALLALVVVISILAMVFTPETPMTIQYGVKNALYNNGEIIIPLDQNVWWFEDSTILDNTVVTVIFDDNGTPNNIYDDIILDVVAQ